MREELKLSSSAFFIKIEKISKKETNNQNFFNACSKLIKNKIINNYKIIIFKKIISAYKDYKFSKNFENIKLA